jgi:hypothetical protein
MWEAHVAFHICTACLQPELLRRPVVERAVRAFAVILAAASLPGYSAHRSRCGTRLRSSTHRATCRGSSRHGRSASDFPAGYAPARPSSLPPSSACCREVNSGPLSERRFSGRPRSTISRSSTRVTRPAAQAEVGFQRQALARVRVDHAEDAHHPARRQTVDDEVHRPLLVRPGSAVASAARSRTRRLRFFLRTNSTASPPDTADRPASRSPHRPLRSQQRMQPPIAVARLLPCQLHQLARVAPMLRSGLEAHTGSSTAPRPTACRPCARSDHARPERTPLPPLRPASSSRFFGSLPSAPRHEDSAQPPATSDRRFSSSIAFSRCASLTSMPPNFDFQP